MRQIRPEHRAARSMAVAMAGLFVGHLLVYRIIAPNGLQRAVLLAESGHGYLPAAIAAGLVAAAIALSATFAFGFARGALRTARGAGWGATRWAADRMNSPRLQRRRALLLPAIAQALAFVALETLERLLAHAGMGSLIAVLPLGVVLQLAIGVAGGAALWAIDHGGECLGAAVAAHRGASRRSRRATPLRRRPLYSMSPRHTRHPSTVGIRGPPPASCA